jgi:hypothetical protein
MLELLGDEPLEEELLLLEELPATDELKLELLLGVVLELLPAFDEPLEELPPLEELEPPLLDELPACSELLELKGQVLLKEPPSSQWSKCPSRHILL